MTLRVRAFVFRCAFVYWILWGVPLALQQFARLTQTPGMGVRYWAMWSPITRVVGTTLLGFPEPPEYSAADSGDSPFMWTLVVVQLAIALLVATVWSLAQRRTDNLPRLRAGLDVGLRFLFGFILLEYGAAKVLPMQFPPPRLEVLATPFGELAPTTLLWAFMGASPIYNVFAGLVEMAAGGLLFFRRTAVAGALLGIGAITNVLVLNMGYDVGVKLLSIHYILLGLWLVAPVATQLFRALRPLPGPSRGRRYAAAASAVLLIVVSGLTLRENSRGRRTFGDLAPKPPLHGIYRISHLASDGEGIPAEWRFAQLIIPTNRGPAQVRLPDGRVLRYRLAVDTTSREVVIGPTGVATSRASTTVQDTFTYRATNAGLEIRGRVRTHHVYARLTRLIPDSLPVLRQQFRWVR